MFKVFLNSFFIQSAWSFEKMQGLGFAAAIAPAINDIYKDTDRINEAMKRHTVFYNAHPYMASPILGAVIKMEEEVKEGKRDAKDIASFKENLVGPYGAIGDTFFWGSIRPFASVLGIISAIFWDLWGHLVFLVIYNIFHLWMRWFGLYKGYKLGENVVAHIKSLSLPQWVLRVRLITAGILGGVVAGVVLKGMHIAMGQTVQVYQIFLAAILAAVLVVLSAAIMRNRVSILMAIYLLFLPAFIFFIMMGIIK
ncbi:MAG: PTS system mannose/fructose/sorbose family transporter subunit IID [Deltaproteobacteria bacterium]|nr:PTS system mannose/fructose/sorbose family transporter subunit IID [Deltaproteobacteria bacterium]